MAARRYEIYLRVLKHEKRNFVSPSDHRIFFLLYKILWRFSEDFRPQYEASFSKSLQRLLKIA